METKIFEENILPVYILDQFLKAEPHLTRSVLIAAKTKFALLMRYDENTTRIVCLCHLLVQGIKVKPHRTPEGDNDLLTKIYILAIDNKQLA